jgi:hypothetical protein
VFRTSRNAQIQENRQVWHQEQFEILDTVLESGNVLAKASGISPIPGMTTRLFVSNNLCLLLPPYTTNQLYNGKMLDPN